MDSKACSLSVMPSIPVLGQPGDARLTDQLAWLDALDQTRASSDFLVTDVCPDNPNLEAWRVWAEQQQLVLVSPGHARLAWNHWEQAQGAGVSVPIRDDPQASVLFLPPVTGDLRTWHPIHWVNVGVPFGSLMGWVAADGHHREAFVAGLGWTTTWLAVSGLPRLWRFFRKRSLTPNSEGYTFFMSSVFAMPLAFALGQGWFVHLPKIFGVCVMTMGIFGFVGVILGTQVINQPQTPVQGVVSLTKEKRSIKDRWQAWCQRLQPHS